MSEERHTEGQGRSGYEDDTGQVSFVASRFDECPPEPPAAILLSETARHVAPLPSSRLARRRLALSHGWRNASPNLRGSVYMLSSLLVYAVMVGAMKHVGAAIPLVEILMIRQIIMTAVIMAISGAALPMLMRTRRPGLQITRGLVTLASMLCGFMAVIHIPLAQATAIGFSQVFFVTIAAVLFLGEKVDARRWAATALGFAGVVIMLDPSTRGLNIFALMSVGGAFFGAAITVSVRKLAATERTETILLYQGAVLMAVLAVPCWLFWVQPTSEQWFWLVVLSVFGTAGQWLITRAYQVGEAAALAPLDFTRLLLSSFTGFVFFGEIPAVTTWIGAAIVIGATLYTIRENARRKNARPARLPGIAP